MGNRTPRAQNQVPVVVMRYTKFFINKTISRITKNPKLRAAARSTLGIGKGTGKLLIAIIFNPAIMGIGAALVGIYTMFTIFGNMSTTLTNMTSSTSTTGISSVYASSFNMLSSTSSMLPIVVFAIAGIFPLMFIMRLLGSDLRGGAL